MKNLVERVTCNKCQKVDHYDLEVLNKEPIKVSETSLLAVVIKRFNCGECGSKESTREFVRKTKTDEVI